jgi:hypothetical protein
LLVASLGGGERGGSGVACVFADAQLAAAELSMQ